jgi:hypothetical protein
MRDLDLECMIKIRNMLEKCWDETTIWHKAEFKPELPSAGQCYVTSLLLQDIFGGIIVSADILYKEKYESHYWFKLPNGREFDLTSDQFDGDGINPMPKSKIFGRWILRKPNGKCKRYLRLKKKIIREFFRNV